MADDRVILEVNDLKTYFFTRRGIVKAVDGVSFSLRRGESLGLVGESGCGKTITSLSLLRLVPQPAGRIVGGEISLTVSTCSDYNNFGFIRRRRLHATA
jgi:ABC-type dipeptide/oligopeptide/nickel transport system ATPase component